MSIKLDELKKWFQDNREAIYRDYFTFLSFKSIATDPAFHDETKKCAAWLEAYLKNIGLETELWPTSYQPVLFAKHCKAGDNRPTLLIYHHYDVQPVDPIELWETDPFTPTIRNGKVYARGAQDNKGQCFYSITAIKAFLALCKDLNFNLKVFIEGEEECGSKGTREVFATKKEALKSDYLLIVDSGIPGPNTPAITLGIRGIITLELALKAAKGDMHSGTFGGIAYNPNRALVKALSSLWDDEGKVAIAHFYDDVKDVAPEELKHFTLERDEKRLREEFGLTVFCPEPGYTLGQSASIRPTVELNGISGGYTGEGFKTVLPACASAKISCRLVPNQNPEEIVNNLKNHLLKHLPKGLEVTITCDSATKAFRVRHDSSLAKLVAKAYEEVLQKPCQYILMGGSIPVTIELADASQAETILMGYGLDSDQIHAPNEHFDLARFEQGFLTMGSIFTKLALE